MGTALVLLAALSMLKFSFALHAIADVRTVSDEVNNTDKSEADETIFQHDITHGEGILTPALPIIESTIRRFSQRQSITIDTSKIVQPESDTSSAHTTLIARAIPALGKKPFWTKLHFCFGRRKTTFRSVPEGNQLRNGNHDFFNTKPGFQAGIDRIRQRVIIENPNFASYLNDQT